VKTLIVINDAPYGTDAPTTRGASPGREVFFSFWLGRRILTS
jgi:hypothetical protein